MKKKLCVVLVAAAACVFSASAELIMTVSQVGSNVVAIASGSVNLDAVVLVSSTWDGIGVVPTYGYCSVGEADIDLSVPDGCSYYGISGPDSIGSSSTTVEASSGSGDAVGMFATASLLLLPENYVSGAELYGTATFENSTISGLGLDEGQYVYTWGSGDTADSLTVNIGVVPEPATAGLLGMSCVALWLIRRFKKYLNYYRS